jgi:pilus assembly protein Flp/PilA
MTRATSCFRALTDNIATLSASIHCWAIGTRSPATREHGATAVEYALMLGLFAIAIIGAVSLFGNRLNNLFETYSNTIPT